jgi:FixJ family two-component response regulator
MTQDQTVYVVDDEPAVGRALGRLLRAIGYTAEVFGSAEEFLNVYKPARGGCLVADFSMPEISGLELQKRLADLGHRIPIVFVTGLDDITDSEREMMMDGAVGILKKPVNPADLLAAIDEALARDRKSRRAADLTANR